MGSCIDKRRTIQNWVLNAYHGTRGYVEENRICNEVEQCKVLASKVCISWTPPRILNKILWFRPLCLNRHGRW